MKRVLFFTFALFASLFAMAQSSQRPQYVVFRVIPKTATVIIGGKSVATDSDGVAIFTLPNGTYNYTVSAKACRSTTGTFEVYGEKVIKSVELLPMYGWLTISTSNLPDGAKIYIDGALVEQMPIEKHKLSSGNHTVRIVHECYKPFVRTVAIRDVQTSELTPTLTPRKGTLNITSTPAFANVYVDEKHVGQTPLMVDLIIGKHKVKVSKGDFGVEPQNVTISEGAVTDVNLTLTKIVRTDFVETTKGLNIKMVYVEGGTFQMGATSEQGSDAESDEKPVHSVTLDSYYIAETEVTQAQWRAIMGNNPSSYSGDNRPVESVSWFEAQTFCEKLSAMTGKKYVLPTEAQWEYAARGGNKSKGYTYSGSNDINSVAKYNSSDGHNNVKSKQPNELGIYDMSGNVWEWCSDWYGSYSSSSQTNPTGPSSGSYRVLRGGGWYYYAKYCRVSYRNNSNPSYRYDYYGFRVVCLP